jgi:uncharacterized protein YfaP (DUF2135 family)
LLDDITTGFGPEMFEVKAPTAFPYRLGAHYFTMGPEGMGMGTVDIIRYDGKGDVTVEHRPFVIQNTDGMIDLGSVY